MRKLREPEPALQRLMDSATGLGDRLGPVLFQFPATWHANRPRLGSFLEALRRFPRRRWTFEFRHESWLVPSVYRLLERRRAALCLPVGPRVPLDPVLTTGWTYVRMHRGRRGVGYSSRELEEWRGRVAGWRDEGFDAYVYFNNDTRGHALRDARRLREMLGLV